MSDFSPKDLTGLTGWFTGDSFDVATKKWSDKSGNQNHANVTKGTVSKVKSGAGQGNSTHPYLTGKATDGIRFPAAVMTTPSQYTLFHVAKYNGPNKGRIFDGVDTNWLSGFWGEKSGVAHHEGWVTPLDVDVHGTEWVVSMDQRNVYRSNGVVRGTVSNGSSTTQLTINHGRFAGEKSDWAVAEVIVYGRELSASEYAKVETYLIDKYQKAISSSDTIWNPLGDGFFSMGNVGMWVYVAAVVVLVLIFVFLM